MKTKPNSKQAVTAVTVVESVQGNALATLGQQANEYAQLGIFDEYRAEIADNTRRRQDGDLALFGKFLQTAKVYVCDLATSAECWRGVSWGIVKGFKNWQLKQGYAIGSINVRLATIKRYAELAFQAGVIDEKEYTLIKAVKGISYKKAVNTDSNREVTRRVSPTGKTLKKHAATELDTASRRALYTRPNTPQGRRDALMMRLLIAVGLRCSEVASLKVSDFNLEAGTFTVYRKKTKKLDILYFTIFPGLAAALTAYLQDRLTIQDGSDRLLLGSRKGGKLGGVMSERAINQRVGDLGRAAGIDKLSPHDLRHDAATRYAPNNDIRTIMDQFGWSSSAMAAKYMNSTKIANEKLIVPNDD